MSMNLLEEIYSRIHTLRQAGVKMKDIANYINLPSSVLSALYSTVLPEYINGIKAGSQDEALDHAIALVNNVSKKRLLSSAADIHTRLGSFNPNNTITEDLFVNTLDKFARKIDDIAYSYLGTYVSYSLSSARDALKMEPFVLYNGENNQIKAARKSVYNTVNNGMVIITNGHTLYAMLNESDSSQLALVTLYLQLPFYENAKFLRGIYITLDYNRNPIARRVVFIKTSDEYNMELFDTLKSGTLLKNDLSVEQQAYYDYVSQRTDCIRMCSIPSPKFNEEDLVTEKNILNLM